MTLGLHLPRRVAALVGCGLAFLAYVLISSTWSVASPWLPLGYWASLALAFALGLWLKDVEWPWGLYLVGLSLAFAIAWWTDWQAPNYFGCAFAIGLAGAIVNRMFWFIPIGLLGLGLTGSRGAIFATGVCLLIYGWRSFRFSAILAFLISILVVVLISRPEVAGFDRSGSLMARLGVWQDTLTHLTVLGHGVGSFFDAYGQFERWTNMGGIRPPHAYNDMLELMFEFGIGSLLLWSLVLGCLESQSPQRLVAWTFFALGLTFFPLFIPGVAHMFALTLGYLARSEPKWALSIRPSLT